MPRRRWTSKRCVYRVSIGIEKGPLLGRTNGHFADLRCTTKASVKRLVGSGEARWVKCRLLRPLRLQVVGVILETAAGQRGEVWRSWRPLGLRSLVLREWCKGEAIILEQAKLANNPAVRVVGGSTSVIGFERRDWRC